jgi:cytochrome b
VVVGTMAATCIVLVKLLGILGERHDRLLGLPPAPRRQQPWLRSLSGERASDQRRREHVSALDVVLVGMVLLAVVAFEVWFFFFSGSSLPAGG